MEISRREFLRHLGITTAGVSLAGMGCDAIWSVPDEFIDQIGGAPRIETWKSSVCSLCEGGCGIKVRLIDGIPVRIHGNPLHPVNQGGICPTGEAGIEALFSTARIKNPLMRLGERGGNRWESISWEEALQIVAARMQKLKEQDESHKLAFLTDSQNSLLSDLIKRFMSAYGSPNVFYLEENQPSLLTTYITQGHENAIGYDFKDTKLLLNFGADLLDTGPSPVRFNQIYSALRNPADGQRAKIVHIGSRFSRTAGNSSEWIPIRPGTMAAMALAMANVMIKDGQYDKRFIADNCFGFEDWQDSDGNTRTGFKTLALGQYYPEKVSEITGVPAFQIVELAREFSSDKSALSLAGGEAANSSNGLYTLWAIECLNALKGNYTGDGPLSLIQKPPFTALSQIQPEKTTANGRKQLKLNHADNAFCFATNTAATIVQHLIDKKPYDIDTLLLGNVNPVFNSANPRRFMDALRDIPFIVSFASFLDESSINADLIMPDHIFLEKSEGLFNVPMVGFRHLGMQQPVVKPLQDTQHTGDVILQLSAILGENLSSALPWPDYQAYLKHRVEGIYKTGTGTVFTERMDDDWLTFLKERGWQMFDYSNFDEFWDVLLENGGWWDPLPTATQFSERFQTPSRKFEFHSGLLENRIKAHLDAKADMDMDTLLQQWQITARGDTVYLPHFEPPNYQDDNNLATLHLLTYPLITSINGAGANLALVQELFGLLTREYWQTWAEFNPETAHQNHIQDGDMVKLTSEAGSLVVKAKINPAVMPAAVQIPFGLGRKDYSGAEQTRGVNPHEILSETYDFLSGRASLLSTKVTIEKVTGKEVV